MPNLVWGEGPVPCKIMLIGEAPGATEEKEGRPFCGQSGGCLDDALQRVGVTRNSLYITNAYKLRPLDNRDPTRAELEDHAPYLAEEFRRVEPDKIVLLGRVAFNALFPQFRGMSLSRWRNTNIYSQVYGGTFRVVWHPAHVLRNRSEFDQWVKELTWLTH